MKNFIKVSHLMVLLFVVSLFFVSNSSYAQAPLDLSGRIIIETDAAGAGSGLEYKDPRAIVIKIISASLGLIGIIMVVLVVYAGYLYMTAGGEEEQVKTAKSYLKNAIIGLIIILLAYSITNFVVDALVESTTETTSGG